MTNPNDQAFPIPAGPWVPSEGGVVHHEDPGMTKREEIAKAALSGLLAAGRAINIGEKSGSTPEIFAAFAVEAADALIAELNKEPK